MLNIPLTLIVIVGVTNAINLADGLDGLAGGISLLIFICIGWLAYSGLYIPEKVFIMLLCSAVVGAIFGFLRFNTYPATVFMGDTGSLAIGGIIAVFAIVIRKELLIPILCGIFFTESLSVMIQVTYFKRTKKKYGEGKRIFRMAPIHHHYQKKGFPEPKIVTRFWIIGILLAVITIVTLKIR